MRPLAQGSVTREAQRQKHAKQLLKNLRETEKHEALWLRQSKSKRVSGIELRVLVHLLTTDFMPLTLCYWLYAIGSMPFVRRKSQKVGGNTSRMHLVASSGSSTSCLGHSRADASFPYPAIFWPIPSGCECWKCWRLGSGVSGGLSLPLLGSASSFGVRRSAFGVVYGPVVVISFVNHM
jgi:hypothetical protein